MADSLRLSCPDCGSNLVIDAATGTVLEHQPNTTPSEKEAGKPDLDDLLARVDEGKARAEARFAEELSAHENRKERLEKRFEEAKRLAEEAGDLHARPERPWDFE